MRSISPSPTRRDFAWRPPTGTCPGPRGVSGWLSRSFRNRASDRSLVVLAAGAVGSLAAL